MKLGYVLLSAVLDVKRLVLGVVRYPRFVWDWRRYTKLPGAQPLQIINAHPCLSDWTSTTEFDHHYIYLNAWALEKIYSSKPAAHVDVGSQIGFVTMLAMVVPVRFIDIRPLEINLTGLTNEKGSVLSMPFGDQEVQSISSLHVIEHIGLGRYGDPLDPFGSRKAFTELARIVARGGSFYLGLPVGRKRICFNAHRIYDPVEIVEWAHDEGLTVMSFAAVTDQRQFIQKARPEDVRHQEYACGMYHFMRTT